MICVSCCCPLVLILSCSTPEKGHPFWEQFIKFFFFKILYTYFWREGEKDRDTINVWLPVTRPLLGTWPETQACALTGNWTGDPLVHRPALNPLSHTSQGSRFLSMFSHSQLWNFPSLLAASKHSLLCLLAWVLPVQQDSCLCAWIMCCHNQHSTGNWLMVSCRELKLFPLHVYSYFIYLFLPQWWTCTSFKNLCLTWEPNLTSCPYYDPCRWSHSIHSRLSNAFGFWLTANTLALL